MCKSIDPEPRILGNWLLGGGGGAESIIIAGPVSQDDRNHGGVFVVCFKWCTGQHNFPHVASLSCWLHTWDLASLARNQTWVLFDARPDLIKLGHRGTHTGTVSSLLNTWASTPVGRWNGFTLLLAADSGEWYSIWTHFQWMQTYSGAPGKVPGMLNVSWVHRL